MTSNKFHWAMWLTISFILLLNISALLVLIFQIFLHLLDSLSQKYLHIRATKRAKIYKVLFWYKVGFMFELISFLKFWCIWTFLLPLGPKIPTRGPKIDWNWGNLTANVFYQTVAMKKSSVCKISGVKTAF